MDDPTAAIHLDNLAFTALVGSSGDHNFIVLSNRQGLDVVLGAKLLAKGSSHHLTTDVGRGRKVGLAALAAG